MRGDIKWTNLSRRQIAERMGALGTPVSRDVVSQLLRQHGYRRRKAQKKKTMGHHRDRNAQFGVPDTHTPSDWRQLEFPSPKGGCLATSGNTSGGCRATLTLASPSPEQRRCEGEGGV